jgi:hypothetical protein
MYFLLMGRIVTLIRIAYFYLSVSITGGEFSPPKGRCGRKVGPDIHSMSGGRFVCIPMKRELMQ